MVTIGLLSVVFVAAIGLVFFVLARWWTLEVAFVRVSWIPIAALLLQLVFFGKLAAKISYFAVAFPVLTCLASLLLALVGATLVASARQRQDDYSNLLRATILASIPGVLLSVYIVYAFVRHYLTGGA